MASVSSKRTRLRSKSRARRRLSFRTSVGVPVRRAVFEVLEQRVMLTVAQDLQNLIAPYQTAINNALSVATSLPLVGHQLSGLQDLNTLLQNSLQSIENTVQNVENGGHFQFAIPLPGISHTFTFDLGLDALFLQVSTSGGMTAAINPVLNVGFDVQDGDVSLDTSQTNLDIGFSLSLTSTPSFSAPANVDGRPLPEIIGQC